MTAVQSKVFILGLLKKSAPPSIGMDRADGAELLGGYVYAPYIPLMTTKDVAHSARSRRRLQEFVRRYTNSCNARQESKH